MTLVGRLAASAYLVSITAMTAIAVPPGRAQADVGDELFQATLLFEQAYLGKIHLEGDDVVADSKGTFGASLRVEMLLGEWVGLGVEGNAGYFQADGGPILVVDDTPYAMSFEGHHLIAGTNGFVRLRFGLANGLAEYYFIGGGGPAVIDYDPNDPNAFGNGIAGANGMGWTAYFRFGIRGELVPGFGALVEFGWLHREHQDVFVHTPGIPGAPAATFDYVVNQMSITLGWYLSH